MLNLIDLFNRLTKEELIKIKRYFIIGVCQTALIIFVLCIYNSHYNTSIGVVNITGIADDFIKTQAQSGLSPEELKKRVRDFGAALEVTLHSVGAKRRTVLMPAEAVITGAKDYTQEVRSRLSKIIPNVPPRQLSQEKQTMVQAPSLEQPLLQVDKSVSPTTLLQETNQTEALRGAQ